MGTMFIYAKYSLLLLLVSNLSIHCETVDIQETDRQLKEESKDIQNTYTNIEVDNTKVETIIKENSKEFKKSEFCDKENEDCDEENSLRSQSLKQETAVEDPNEPKTKAGLEKDSSPVQNALHENEEILVENEVEHREEKDNENTGVKETESIETQASQSTKDEISDIPQALNNESVKNRSTSEPPSTIYQWLKFILEPIIEEFKDGIYPKLSDKTNVTVANVSVTAENTTVEVEKPNATVPEPANITETEKNATDTVKKVKFQCTGKNVTDNVNSTVKLITTAQLLQLLNFEKNETENVTDCLLVMFYAPWCHFCAKVAPHYNALARAFPQLDFVAVDTAQFSNLLARFGTVSVPNILVFHQSRAAVKFNQTERTFENFVTFVTNSTGLEPNGTVNVTDADYLGPVPSVPTNEPDYLLLISWMFVLFCSSCMFVKSNKGQQWINRVRILWQEHQHID